ncbi:MAG: hypothetical protein Q4E51_02750 [Lachnospiraceae bacterium]|nr:hypothetical protein [Lachnospiraceae bacterium]
MPDGEKTILMTHIAAYEQQEELGDLKVNSYFRGDYISMEVLKGAIYGTIGFAIIFLMYVLYDLETFMVEFYKMDIVSFFQGVLSKYIIFIAIYVVISYFVAAYRYGKAKKNVKLYQNALKNLYSYYN